MTISAAVVIPTRNRADLAIVAIRSLLAIDDSRLRHVIVSNNSSEPRHIEALERACRRIRDTRLILVRPPRALPMAEHWDWAIEEALVRSDATHLALHYDRRVSKPELRQLLELCADWPDRAITYLLDVVYSRDGRYFAYSMPWSGRVYEIETAQAVRVAAHGRLTDLWQSFPVLVNCITPRGVFARVRERFGNICASTSPESCFGFRFSAVEPRYLHFDRALGVHYAFARSNGMGYLRNDTSGSFADFVTLFGDRSWLDAAPLPGVSLGQNSFYHEYSVVRRDAPEAEFPAIEMQGYLDDLGRGLRWIADPQKRAQLADLLVQHGWRGTGADSNDEAPTGERTASERIARFRADYLPLKHEANITGFRREARAIEFLRKFAAAPMRENASLALLQPRGVEP